MKDRRATRGGQWAAPVDEVPAVPMVELLSVGAMSIGQLLGVVLSPMSQWVTLPYSLGFMRC